jgi:glucokinase
MSESLLLGIDLGGTKTAVILGDATGRVLAREQFATATPWETRERIVAAARGFDADFERVGIACGGPLDVARGRILAPPNLPGWEGAELVSWFEADFGKPVALVNDANAGALAEWRWGAGRGVNDLVFLTCGTGLGAGIIAGGRLFAGASGNAGEIGHVRLTEGGPLGYGKPGSVEGWASGGGIARQAGAAGWPAGTSTKDIAHAADAGDERAIALLAEAGAKLGRALAVLVDLLNPEMIVLGSLYVRAQRHLEHSVRRELQAEALPELLANCRVVPAALGESIGDLQALAAALEASVVNQKLIE